MTCHIGLVHTRAHTHTGLLCLSDTCKSFLTFPHPPRGAHTPRHVLRGVKEQCCPRSQSYWAVMTLEDVGFSLFTSVIE